MHVEGTILLYVFFFLFLLRGAILFITYVYVCMYVCMYMHVYTLLFSVVRSLLRVFKERRKNKIIFFSLNLYVPVDIVVVL